MSEQIIAKLDTIEELLVKLVERTSKITKKQRSQIAEEIVKPEYVEIAEQGEHGCLAKIADMLTEKLGFYVNYEAVYYQTRLKK